MTRKNGWYYSPSEQGFFRPDVHSNAIPADSIAISDDLYEELRQGNNTKGKRIMPPDGSHKLPWLADPPPPSKADAAKAKLAEVMQGYTASFTPIEAIYPAAEREGWPVQEAEAKALAADPEATTPVLSLLVGLRAKGETVAELANKVLANAQQWRMVYASLTGQQQRMYADVMGLAADNTATAETIVAYTVNYDLPEGM